MLQTGTVAESTFGLLKRLQAEPLLASYPSYDPIMAEKVYDIAPLVTRHR